MNCLNAAILKATEAEMKTAHAKFYEKAIKVSEKEKLTALFDQRMTEAGFHVKQPVAIYNGEGPFAIFSEWKFWPQRKFAFDRAWPGLKLAVEIEGGVWRKGGGAHSHPTNIMRDIEKYNGAVILGWRILRFTDYHLKSPYAVECVTEAIKGATL